MRSSPCLESLPESEEPQDTSRHKRISPVLSRSDRSPTSPLLGSPTSRRLSIVRSSTQGNLFQKQVSFEVRHLVNDADGPVGSQASEDENWNRQVSPDATATVVSVTEAQLASVFEFLTHYFVAMYVLETGGQASTVLAELVFVLGGIRTPCFSAEMLMLDLVFVLLLLMDVVLSVQVAGLKKYMKKRSNRSLMLILIVSCAGLVLQALNAMSENVSLVIDVVKNILRAARVLIFYRKLQIVLKSPLSHWDMHDDILQTEEEW